MTTQTDLPLSVLVRCPLFKGLSEDQLATALDPVSWRIRTYGKEAVVATAGEELHAMQVIIQGAVKGEMIDYGGKVIKIEDIEPPRPLAPAFLFGSQNRYPVNLVANGTVKLFSIPRDAFLGMMQENALILRNFVDIISSRGQFLSGKIKFLNFSGIRGKLARCILEQAEQQNSLSIRLPYSQNQLSEMFGVARPSIGRTLGEMNREGIIRTEGKDITILDRIRLQEQSQ